MMTFQERAGLRVGRFAEASLHDCGVFSGYHDERGGP